MLRLAFMLQNKEVVMEQYLKSHLPKHQEKLDEGMSMSTMLHIIAQAISDRGEGVKKVSFSFYFSQALPPLFLNKKRQMF